MGNVAKPRYHHNRQPNAKSESAWELKPIRVGPLMVCRTFFHLTRPAANDGEGLRAAWWPTAPALVERGRQRRFKNNACPPQANEVLGTYGSGQPNEINLEMARQGKTESGSAKRRFVIHSHVAIMRFNNGSTDRQPHSHAGVFGREETVK